MRTCNVQQEKLQNIWIIINYEYMIILNKLATSNLYRNTMKNTALTHIKGLGAKCFRLGYNMPITYEGINAE
jgi:hypothetical protein